MVQYHKFIKEYEKESNECIKHQQKINTEKEFLSS